MGKADRPSPSASATALPVGTKKRGNDGNMYVIKADKSGRPSWKKDSATAAPKVKALTAKAASPRSKAAAPKARAAAPKAVRKSSLKRLPIKEAKRATAPKAGASGKGSSYPAVQLAKFEKKSPKMKPLKVKGHAVNFVTWAAVGRFKTSEWEEDPARPSFLGEPPLGDEEEDNEIGFYRVLFADIVDAARTTHRLTIVVNDGDTDCNTGYWGGVYRRDSPGHEELVQIRSSGDTHTSVRTNSKNASTFREHTGKIFPPTAAFEEDFEDEQEGARAQTDEYKFQSAQCCLRPGNCKGQLSKFVGCVLVAMCQNEMQ